MGKQDLETEYAKKFDAKHYIEIILKERNAMSIFIENTLHAIFDEMEVSPGMKLLDVGCGPTVDKVLGASRKFGYIVLSDIIEENLHELEKFVEGAPDAADWSSKAKQQAYLEGFFLLEKAAEKIIKRTRQAIKKVLPGDILMTNVLPQEHRDSFDVVISNLCLETAASDKTTYERGVGNLSNLIKPGGTVILRGVCGSPGHFCGETFLPSFPLTEGTIRVALNKSGLAVTRWEIREIHPEEKLEARKDFCYVIVAEKTA